MSRRSTTSRARVNRRKSDSHPANFALIDLRDMVGEGERLLSYNNSLDFLSVDAVRNCLHEATRGAYAQIQWLWEQLEPADPILATCVDRRESALKKIPWDIVKMDGLSDIEDAIADAQLRTVQDFCNAVIGIDAAIAALGQASFRSFRRVQMLEQANNLELVVTENWNWARHGYNGEWRWNPKATFGSNLCEDVPVPESSILTRWCPRPIDQVAMMLCLDRKNAKAQWMCFNGRYGVPPLFVVLPPGTNEQTKRDYIEFARQCISNAGGVLPPGADLKTASVQAGGPDTFRGIIDLSTQELVLRATGGLTTMLTAPGEGTNTGTGNAHQDSFDDLADGEGSDIAGTITQGMIYPVLDQWHPGQPRLVEFVIKRPESDDTAASVTNITSLAGAGYRATDEQVTELTGLEVSSANMDSTAIYAAKAAGYVPQMSAMEQRMGMPLQPAPMEDVPGQVAALRDMQSRYAPTMLWPAARREFDARMTRDINAASRALSAHAARRVDDALAAIDPDAVRRRAAAYEQMLLQAAEDGIAEAIDSMDANSPAGEPAAIETGNEPETGGDPVATPLQNAGNGNEDSDDEKGKDTNAMSRSEAARHAANVRWGKEGRIGRNRGIGREGKTRSPGKSNTPLKVEDKAGTGKKVDAVEKSIRKTARKGGKVSGVAKIGKNSLTIEHGTPGRGKEGVGGYGSSHAANKHFKLGDTDARKSARAIVHGKKSKDRDDIMAKYKQTRSILIKKGKRTLSLKTAYNGRKKKK